MLIFSQGQERTSRDQALSDHNVQRDETVLQLLLSTEPLLQAASLYSQVVAPYPKPLQFLA